MNDSTLDDLLHAISVAPPDVRLADPRTLAARAMAAARRRRMRRAAALVGCGLALPVAVFALTLRANSPTRAPAVSLAVSSARPAPPARASAAPIDAAQIRLELAVLESRAAVARRVAESLVRAEEHRTFMADAERRLAQPDPLAEAESQIEQAAFWLVTSAERRARAGGSREQLAADYRAVVRDFSGTDWAAEAETRLENLKLN